MLTRRDLLKLGLLSSGYTILAPGSRPLRVFADGANNLPASPATTPFIASLPIPPAPKPVASFVNDVDKGCLPFIGSGTRFFKIIEEERLVRVHPELAPTSVWGYRDVNVPRGAWPFVLGPTFKVNVARTVGEGVVVRMDNRLPSDHVGFGVPHTTTHLHGGHHPSRSDGLPDNITHLQRFVSEPGESYDYCYPMLDPGFFTPPRDETERPSTLWYHDHLFDFTGPNVYRGLAGFFLVFDELDTGKETTGLRLPSGPYDIPLVLQDKRVGADGQLIFNPLEHDGFLGDKFFVNGAVQPFLNVKKRKYRFRFLNGSNARFYRIFLASSSGETFPMDQIATEGGLLAAPIRGIQSFQIGPAERVEVVVDFKDFPAGTNLFFENRQEQNDGALPGEGVLRHGTQLLKLIVQGETVSDPSQVPNVLRPFDPISPAELARATRKTFEFDNSDGGWVINDQFADLEHALTTSRINTPEIWHLESGGGWAHPVHLHLEFVRVLRRDGKLPPLNERDGMAKKDTVNIGGPDFGDVEIFVKFRDYRGPFVFHCHNLEHEDMRMMARMDIL